MNLCNLFNRSTFTGLLISAGALVAAFGFRWLLDPALGANGPYMFFILASMVSARWGGPFAGLMTIVLGAWLSIYFFIPPYYSALPVGSQQWSHLLAYFAVSAAAVFITAALRMARMRAAQYDLLARSRGEELERGLQEITVAEEKIRELAAVVESAQDAILTLGLDYRIKSWNPAAEQLFQYPSQEIVGREIFHLIPEDLHALTREALQAVSGGKAVSFPETWRLPKGGQPLNVSLSLSPLRDSSGKVIGISSISRDLTAVKRAELALQASEQRFRVMADAAPVMIWMTDSAKQCVWVNRTWLDFTGRSLQQELGEGWLENVPVHQREDWLEELHGPADQTQAMELEFHLRRHDGEYRWVLGRGVPHLVAGQFQGYIGSCLDVTERKKAEEALEQKLVELRKAEQALREQNQLLAEHRKQLEVERARYRELFDSAPIAYLITNRQGVIEAANQEAAGLLNDSSDSLIGFPLDRLLSEQDRSEFFANVGRLTRGEERNIENWEVMVEPRGRPGVPCGISVNILRTEQGEIAGLRWLLRDVSERRLVHERMVRLNAELEHRVKERTADLEAANRELEAFSYSVSHDLRAPLRSISGFSRAVLEDYADQLDEQGVTYLRYSHEAALRMSRLIDDLLAFSRFSRQEMRKQEVDLSDLAKGIIRDLQRGEPQRNVEVSIAPEVKVRGDEALLRIALQNLLNNAWKFTSKGESAIIELGATQKDGTEVYYVRDNGAGFNMAHAERLFGVFQRLHTAEEFPGTGVGLATVKRIFHRHGGRIWAEAEENRGATFYFTLPNGS